MIKIGVIGIGRLGSQHLERLLESDYFKVVGCFDMEPSKLQRIQEDYTIKCYSDVDELISKCDAVDILTPSDSHFYYAEKAIRHGKHVFIDKPISNNFEEAKRLVELVREAGIKFQVGHIERFNPAFLALQHLEKGPGCLTLNLGSGQGHSVLEMVRAFEQASGRTIAHRFAPRRAGDLPAFWANADEARRILGWEARCSLLQMCEDTWRWQAGNPRGYEK